MSRTTAVAILFGSLSVGLLCLNVVGQPSGAAPQNGAVEGVQPTLLGSMAPQTRLEGLASQRGVLVSKGYTDIGQVQADDGSRLRVTAVHFTDARQRREQGLAVSVEQRDSDALPVVAYVDYDEMDALAEAMDALAKLDASAGPLAQVEAVYRTSGELEFTSHLSNGGGRIVTVRAMQLLLPSGQVLQGSASFRPARLGEVRQQILLAKETLDRLKEEPGK